MHEACTIGIDLGTSAIKGVLLSADGVILATATRPTELEVPVSGRVVFSSDRCHEILCDILQELTTSAPSLLIGAVSISGATGDTLLLNPEGRPLLPTIHWMDTRSTEDPVVDPPGMSCAGIYRISGWPWFRMFPLAHLAWLKAHEPEAYHQAWRVGMNVTYLNFRLCGAWVIDPSTATTFYLQDQEQQKWHQPYLDWLGLNAEQLPEIQPSGSCVGRISSAAAAETGLPETCKVVLGAFDHPSAARGAGVVKPGDLLLSLGSSWVGFYPLEDRAEALSLDMLIDPFLSAAGGPWGAMFSLTKAGQKLNEALRVSYPDAINDPARYALVEADLRRPLENRTSPRNAAVDLIHELIETMRDRIASFSKRNIVTERIVLAGGPSANGAIVDLFKHMLAKPIEVTSAHSGAVGAALMAAETLSS